MFDHGKGDEDGPHEHVVVPQGCRSPSTFKSCGLTALTYIACLPDSPVVAPGLGS